ncbi:kinase with WD40 repeat at C-terminus [Cryptosporidium bovis]|uniref:kinase with WD40 repeat at C-terminus n=1 Tax=Cryptosporidium bovis TaxID=310047 RepID=UPI00351A6DFB|nr:kinase with WD40 repeat at C-terminus [Cryptosporidium bovis]
MGNLHFTSLKSEEKQNDLLLEFNWLKESGEFINNNRVLYNYKVINSNGDSKIYRFFPGIRNYVNDIEDIVPNLETCTDNTDKSCFIDKTFVENELKYFPSLNGLITANIVNDNSISISIKNIINTLDLENKLSANYFCPNILFYSCANISDNFIFVEREMWESTIRTELDENLCGNNQIDIVIKRWFEFQSIIAILQLQSMGVFHGDIKTDNILTNHLLIIKLTDISPWKPIFIDRTDLRFWTNFFERYNNNINITACNMPPERFKTKDDVYFFLKSIEPSEFQNCLKSMDIFSLGCILKEINDGYCPFTINEILKMSEERSTTENWRDILTCSDWRERPNILDLFLLLSNVERHSFGNIYLYSLLCGLSHEAKFDKSFFTFFYPLSIILQSDMFNDIRIQLIILNMAFPTLLELFVIENIELDTCDVFNWSCHNYISLYSSILSTVKIKYRDGWNDEKLKKIFQSVFDFDLKRDLIFYIIISNLDKDNSFDKYSFDNHDIEESHLNIKGLFSFFQLLLNHWEADNSDRTNEKNTHEMNILFTKIIFENSYYFDDKFDVELNKRCFFEFIFRSYSHNNMSQPLILFASIMLNCIEKMNDCHNGDNEFIDNEILNSINLMSINTLRLLLDLLPYEHKDLLLSYKIFPFFFQFLGLDIFTDENYDYQLKRLNEKSVATESNDMIVVVEIFNLIKDYFNLGDEFIKNSDSYNSVIQSFVLNNIENWIRYYISSCHYEVVVILLRIFRKMICLVIKSKNNEYKLCDWVLEILISNDSTAKLILLEEDNNGSSLLFEIILFHTAGKKDILISEILPHLLNQLNDSDHNVRSGYCRLVTSLLLEKLDTLILPYGEFCLEKSLSDQDLKVKYTAIQCINTIIEKLYKCISSNIYNHSYEVIIVDLVELVTNNINDINQIKIYHPLANEFGRLIYNLIDISIIMKNWLIVYSLLNTYFRADKITTKNLLKLKKLNFNINLNKFDVIVYFFSRFAKIQKQMSTEKCDNYNNLSYGTNILPLVKYSMLSSYLNANQQLLCFPAKLNVFNYKISRHLSLIQLESKFRLRKQIINEKYLLPKKQISRSTFFPLNLITEADIRKPIIKGNYLGSIYCHQNSINREGCHIYQDILYYNGDVYSWSLNDSINSEIYLHKLNAEVNNRYHCWNLITNSDDNHIFKFKDNSSITSMCSLHNDLTIITGNNNGILTKIKLNSCGYNSIVCKEHHYNHEKKLFNFENSIREPSVALIGKLTFNSKQMIISIYSNGDIYIFDPNYISVDFFFSVPPFLGTVIDYCIDSNLTNTNWLCLLTDLNVIVTFNLAYLKEARTWEIQSKSDITKIRTLNQNNESTKIVLYLQENFYFAIFDWNNGKIEHDSCMFSVKEIKSNLFVYSPRLYKTGLLHQLISRSNNDGCYCTLCECQRIRTFRNCILQYSYITTRFRRYSDSYHLMGPITSSIVENCQTRDFSSHNLYIFNDSMGNIHQKNLVIERDGCNFSDPPICILENRDKKNNIEKHSYSKIHKDVLTSINMYSFNDDNFGIFTSSRDGIISYWN